MYEVKEYAYEPKRFLAGDMPVGKEVMECAEDAEILAHSLVAQSGGKAVPYAAGKDGALDVPYGIAAADAENGQVVVYLSGEFYGESLVLPEGVTVDAVKPLARENGIFIKD